MLLKVPSPSPAGETFDKISILRSHQHHFRRLSVLPMKRAETNTKPYQRKNIAEPHPHDVLCGRGASISNFVGNLRWRELVKEKKEEYVKLHKLQRHVLSESIVYAVRQLDPPGRFLQRDPETGLWFDIGDQKANEKTAQALREGAPKLRKKLASSKRSEEAKKEAARRGGSAQSSPTLSGSTSMARSGAEFPTGFNPMAATSTSRLQMSQSMASMIQRNPSSAFEFEPLPLDLGNMFPGAASAAAAATLPNARAEPPLPLPPVASLPRTPSAGLPYRQQTPMDWRNRMENEFLLNQRLEQVPDNKSIDLLHPGKKIDMGFAARNPLSIEHDHASMEPTFDESSLLSHAANLLLNRGKSSAEDEEEDAAASAAGGYKGNRSQTHGDSKPPSL